MQTDGSNVEKEHEQDQGTASAQPPCRAHRSGDLLLARGGARQDTGAGMDECSGNSQRSPTAVESGSAKRVASAGLSGEASEGCSELASSETEPDLALHKRDMDLLEFRAGNPSIPSDVIVGRIHLLVDRYRKSGVDTREPVRATQTQPPVAQTSQSEQFSSGDQLAQSILHMKQIRGRDFDEPTDQEKANTAAKKSPPKTLFPVEHPPNPGEKNRGVVSAATSERACSNFAQRHARASRLLSGTTLLCMLAVPTYMCAADLAQFVAPFAERIRRLRIVWDATRPYGYMALLRFQTPDDAVLFAMEYDEKLFSEAFGQERCRVLPVERVEYHHATQQRSDFIASLAALNDHRSGDVVEWGEPSSKDEERGRWEEWPTCPVCLDRLDLESIVTGLCNHSLHTTCLARWSDPSCPVCRFVATDMPSAKAACEVCHVQTQLWICLVCGHVGCGRYVQHHALAHYRSTHHVFCMEIQSGRVWDYCSDSYVHRVLLNDPDGKHAVLETPTESEAHASPATTGSRGNATRNTLPSSSNRSVTEHEEEQTQLFAATVASKVDSLSQEYELLLFSQLESQRIWFEAKAAELEDIWSRRVRELEQQLQIYRRSGAPPAEEQCHQSESNEMSLKMLRELNERLLRDASTWRERVERLQRERDELADQVNDLLQHIEAGAKISTKSDAGMSVRVEARRFRRRSKP